MATKSNHCVRCGKSFTGIMIFNVILALVLLFFIMVVVIGFGAMAMDMGEEVEGTIFSSVEWLTVSIMGIILGGAFGGGVLNSMVTKHGPNSRSMVCDSCKAAEQEVKKDAVIKAQQAQEAKAYEWVATVDGMEKSDPYVGKLITQWKQAHPNQIPSEGMIDELNMARNYEKAGNFEKSAVILEKYSFWEEAGRVRKLDDEKVIKHITVDMNALIDQISTKGLAIPYKCQSCGATITIDKDSKKEGLKSCSYCGTSYNVEDMTKIIQKALE